MNMRLMALALVFSCFANVAMGEPLPEYYPKFFQFEGTIESINDKTLSILADDYVLRCTQDAIVHTVKDPGKRFDALRVGQRIGVRFQDPTAPRRIVSDIWVLPDN